VGALTGLAPAERVLQDFPRKAEQLVHEGWSLDHWTRSPLRREMTEAERMLWAELRHDQPGWRFRRQHPIPPYIVDFACVEARLVIEADGGQHGPAGDQPPP
jgi:very-short-patch-repair endonuclease